MEKLGFLRTDAIRVLSEMQDDADYLDDSDRTNFAEMSNEDLEAELCLSGIIHDEDMGGVFDILPEGMLNAVEVAETTGWPPSL